MWKRCGSGVNSWEKASFWVKTAAQLSSAPLRNEVMWKKTAGAPSICKVSIKAKMTCLASLMTPPHATFHRRTPLSDDWRKRAGARTLGLSVFGSLSTFSMAVRASNPPTTLIERSEICVRLKVPIYREKDTYRQRRFFKICEKAWFQSIKRKQLLGVSKLMN